MRTSPTAAARSASSWSLSGVLTDDVLTDFYKTRLLVPQVNPNTLARLPAKVVARDPGDMAIELRAIPVSLDGENNLTVAMSDPSDRHAVDEIAFFTGTYVVRAVATQMQIAWCLAHYYGHVTTLGRAPAAAEHAEAAPTTAARRDPAAPARRDRRGRGDAPQGLVPGGAAWRRRRPRPRRASTITLRSRAARAWRTVPRRPGDPAKTPLRAQHLGRDPRPSPRAVDQATAARRAGPIITMEIDTPARR